MSGWGDKTNGSGSGQIPGDTIVPDPSGSYYSTTSSVPANILTNILTYTAPVDKNINLIRAEFGGLNIARYWLFFDNIEMAQYVTWFNGGMTGTWDFASTIGGGLPISPGSVIRIKVEHERPFTADFFARINFIEII